MSRVYTAQQNSQGDNYMMSQGQSPDADTWPVGDRAPPRDLAAQHTLHNATLICTMPTRILILPIQADDDDDSSGRGRRQVEYMGHTKKRPEVYNYLQT